MDQLKRTGRHIVRSLLGESLIERVFIHCVLGDGDLAVCYRL